MFFVQLGLLVEVAKEGEDEPCEMDGDRQGQIDSSEGHESGTIKEGVQQFNANWWQHIDEDIGEVDTSQLVGKVSL